MTARISTMPRKTRRNSHSTTSAAATHPPHGINSRVRVRRRRTLLACNQDCVLCRHPRRRTPPPQLAMRRDGPTAAQEAGYWSDDIGALHAWDRSCQFPAIPSYVPSLSLCSFLMLSGGFCRFTGVLSVRLFLIRVPRCRITSTGVGAKGLSTEATRRKREVSRHGHGANITFFVTSVQNGVWTVLSFVLLRFFNTSCISLLLGSGSGPLAFLFSCPLSFAVRVSLSGISLPAVRKAESCISLEGHGVTAKIKHRRGVTLVCLDSDDCLNI